MNKKILMSFGVIAIVAAIAIGGTIAYFSDTETSKGNTFTAGVIDISIDDQNPWTGRWDIKDMKPCETGYIKFNIQNPGNNPVNVWKTIKNITTDEGVMTEPECVAEGGTWVDYGDHCTGETPQSNLYDVMNYDLSVRVPILENSDGGWWQTIYKDSDNKTVGEINGTRIFLGMIPAGKNMTVTQSYHLIPATDNWAQADTMTFDIEIYAEQLTGSLVLENKSGAPDWQIKGTDTMKGTLTYNLTSPKFDYTFEAKGLKTNTNYRLIYYADPWPGSNPGALIASFTTDGSGNIGVTTGSIDLGMDLPAPADANSPAGAKIWLVTASDYNSNNAYTGPMTGWHFADYLFETGLITYDDTNTP